MPTSTRWSTRRWPPTRICKPPSPASKRPKRRPAKPAPTTCRGSVWKPAPGAAKAAAKPSTAGNQGGATYDNNRVAATLSYELDLWGRIRRSNEAARAEALASRFGRDSLRLTLVGQVTNEYLNLRSLDGQIEVTAQTLESRKQALKIVQARLDAGSASGLELAQAESALNGAQAQWSQLQRLRALSESQIGLLSGQPGLKISATGLDKLPLPPTPPAGLPSALLEARPDIRQAEEKLVAANARIGVAKAAYYPTISLTGLFGSESMALSNLFTSGAGIWSAAAGLAMPIFDAGRTGARVDQATAVQKESLANYREDGANRLQGSERRHRRPARIQRRRSRLLRSGRFLAKGARSGPEALRVRLFRLHGSARRPAHAEQRPVAVSGQPQEPARCSSRSVQGTRRRLGRRLRLTDRLTDESHGQPEKLPKNEIGAGRKVRPDFIGFSPNDDAPRTGKHRPRRKH